MLDDALPPVSRAPLSLLVSRRLRAAIVSGQLGVGTELPSEKELSQRFQVSRPTVREALRILQAQGLLSGGDTVSTARPRVSGDLTIPAAAAALENVLRLGQVPLPDLVELRLVIEGAAVDAIPAGAPGLAEAYREVEVMSSPAIDCSTFHDADIRFHLHLAAAGGNRAIPLVMNVLRHAIAAHLLESLESIREPAPVLARLAAEHAAILAAVRTGELAEARHLLEAHVRRFYAEHGIAHG